MPKRFTTLKEAGEKIALLTAYDATAARLQEKAGVDAMLVGDSLGMVVKGEKDTLNVRISEVAYHVRAVVAGAPNTFVIGDMPFGSFQQSPQHAFANAARLLTAGANMVKIEGGEDMAETVDFLVRRGVPVCAHVGLMPQSVRASGGYAVQGRGDAAKQVHADALSMQNAGAGMVVLELLPEALAQEITQNLAIPTIGIGSGRHCDGQVLVMQDMLGMSERHLRFTHNFLAERSSIAEAFDLYVKAVKAGGFPSDEHAVQ